MAEERLLPLFFLKFGTNSLIYSIIFHHLSFSNSTSRPLGVGIMSEQRDEKLLRTYNKTEQRWRKKKHERNIFAEWHLGSWAPLGGCGLFLSHSLLEFQRFFMKTKAYWPGLELFSTNCRTSWIFLFQVLSKFNWLWPTLAI